MIKSFIKRFAENLILIAPLSLLVFLVIGLLVAFGVFLFSHLHVLLAFLVLFVTFTIVATFIFTMIVFDRNIDVEKKEKKKKGEDLADILPFMPRD